MFGHQDDQNNHHHDDQPIQNVLTEPAVDGVLAGHDDSFNPALPSSDHDQPGAAPTDAPDAIAAPAPFVAPDEPAAQPAAPVSNDLLEIKQQALNELSPLVGHLEQSPEEKFRTTMMMIQASDNQALVKTAYEAAQAIQDEKIKAQALLDIVNEINYFTTQSA